MQFGGKDWQNYDDSVQTLWFRVFYVLGPDKGALSAERCTRVDKRKTRKKGFDLDPFRPISQWKLFLKTRAVFVLLILATCRWRPTIARDRRNGVVVF